MQASQTGRWSTSDNSTHFVERRALRLQHVIERVGISRATIRRMILQKRFPSPRKIGERVAVWDSHVIDAWLGRYEAWSQSSGHHPLSKTKFSRRLADRGFARDAGKRNYCGLVLKTGTI